MEVSKTNPAILDYEDGLERFVNKPELYHRFLTKFVNESVFKDLKKAMEEEDYEAAFQYAHTLKGNTGNLSLVRLYEVTVPLVEALRDAPDIEEAKKLYGEVEAAFMEAIGYLNTIL